MKYLKGCICLMLVFVFVGCVHTNMNTNVKEFKLTSVGEIPANVMNNIKSSMPQYYSETVREVGSNANVKFRYWDKEGKPYEDKTPPNSVFAMNGQTRQAATLGVIKGILNSGVGIFTSSVQGYYGRKTQGAATVSVDSGNQTNTQTNEQNN